MLLCIKFSGLGYIFVRVSMKKIVLLFVALQAPLYSFNVQDYLPKIFQPKEITKAITPKIAILPIDKVVDFKKVTANLVAASKNKEILGIVLVINNYGGQVGAYSVLHDVIKKISQTKPIISLIEQGAYSAGYLIASASNYIIAYSISDVGNIGVILEVTRYKNPKLKTDVLADMNVELLQAGDFKTVLHHYGKELLSSERDYVQDLIDQTYHQVLEKVATNRNLDLTAYKEWAEGKVFIAPEALKLGLIDEIGTIFDVQKKMFDFITKKNPAIVYSEDIDFIEMS